MRLLLSCPYWLSLLLRLHLRGRRLEVDFHIFIVSDRGECQLSGAFHGIKILFLAKVFTSSNLKNTHNIIACMNFNRDFRKSTLKSIYSYRFWAWNFMIMSKTKDGNFKNLYFHFWGLNQNSVRSKVLFLPLEHSFHVSRGKLKICRTIFFIP